METKNIKLRSRHPRAAAELSPRARQRAYRAEIWHRRHLEQLAFQLGLSVDLLCVTMNYLNVTHGSGRESQRLRPDDPLPDEADERATH